MPRARRQNADQFSLLEARVSTAPLVPGIREKVKAWRGGDYKGISATTRILLNYWFCTDHRLPDGRKFKYHYFQQEAVETLIYLYEVAEIRRHKGLVETFAIRGDLRLLQYDDFARYCVKMATGSGKTKVISLAVAWQFFNAVAEARDDFAKTFLLIAPNVIVFERLRTDFEGGRIFRVDPIIPPELQIFWQDFQFYMRGEAERASSLGALYLTNVQQFYERPDAGQDEPEELAAVLGPKPPAQTSEIEDFTSRIADRGGPVVVLNDEAHHTHEEGSEWNKVIRRLHADTAGGLAAQLDFTATPRHSKGQLFSWTVYDYPLKQAIIDNVVKHPLKGIAQGIGEQPSQIASVKYQAYLAAGVERWKEYREQLVPLGKKPILFVMMNDTEEADDVGDWLRTKYPSEFGANPSNEKQLLIIHTDRSGEVSKRDLDVARRVAREVDDQKSPINCIVSVMMLREGWDVQSVTVIVGLRPYSSKAKILPEQTVGRGLRLMFRGASGYVERVDVIGNKTFIEFVEQLEREEDIQLETFKIGEKVSIVTIAPDPNKMDKDIAIPVLSPILTRKKSLAEEIAGLDVGAFNSPRLPRKQGDSAAKTFRYEGYDLVTLQKLIERDYTIPEPQTAEEVIGYYARRIAQDVKLPSQFSVLVPKVREFLETKAFGEPVTLNEPAMIRAISSNVAHYVTVKTFAEALRKLVISELEPQLLHAGRPLSETPPFPWSRQTLPAEKCIFNLIPCLNNFEKEFAQFLQRAPDVERFAKLPEQFGFAIEYTDNAGNLRFYEPDFVALTGEGTYYIVETKGLEDTNVANKDRAAQLWCENATQLTGEPWAYLKVLQTAYKQLQPTEFADLLVLAQGSLFTKGRSLPELSVVALSHPVECKGRVLPEGGKGTVVHVYRDGEHYEVEFADPFPCTVTLRRADIHRE
jgi:type III restriction enzyme